MRRTYLMIITVLALLVAMTSIAAAEDSYFYIKSTDAPYKVVAGENITVNFELVNKGMRNQNVTAYIDGCPMSWNCEKKTFSYEREDAHKENLTIEVSPNTAAKKYTLYLLLANEFDRVTRGDDKLLITVLDAPLQEALSVEEYKAKVAEEERNREPTGIYVPASMGGGAKIEERKATEEEMTAEEEIDPEAFDEKPQEEAPEEQNRSLETVKEDMVQNIERLESDKGFVEYATVVLVILLAVTGVGAFIAWRRKR